MTINTNKYHKMTEQKNINDIILNELSTLNINELHNSINDILKYNMENTDDDSIYNFSTIDLETFDVSKVDMEDYNKIYNGLMKAFSKSTQIIIEQDIRRNEYINIIRSLQKQYHKSIGNLKDAENNRKDNSTCSFDTDKNDESKKTTKKKGLKNPKQISDENTNTQIDKKTKTNDTTDESNDELSENIKKMTKTTVKTKTTKTTKNKLDDKLKEINEKIIFDDINDIGTKKKTIKKTKQKEELDDKINRDDDFISDIEIESINIESKKSKKTIKKAFDSEIEQKDDKKKKKEITKKILNIERKLENYDNEENEENDENDENNENDEIEEKTTTNKEMEMETKTKKKKDTDVKKKEKNKNVENENEMEIVKKQIEKKKKK